MDYLDKVCLFGASHYHHTMDLWLQFYFLALFVVDEPFWYAGAALSVLQQDEPDLNSELGTIECF